MPDSAPNDQASTVAIIGAGIAGATAARRLADAGKVVTVFEKARGPGGRMASRRLSREQPFPALDHGCQMLSEEAPESALPDLAQWTHALAEISGTQIVRTRQRTRPVPTPAMKQPVSSLLNGLELRSNTQVTQLLIDADSVVLRDTDAELGRFDRVIVTAPPVQAEALVRDASPKLADLAASAQMDPCWTIMLQVNEPKPFDAAHVTDHPIAWLCNNSNKPGRSAPDTGHSWIAQFSRDYSREHLERDKNEIAPDLLAAAQELLGPTAVLIQPPHRWRYAFTKKPVGEAFLTDGPVSLAGDWLLGDRAHHAVISGAAAADALLALS